MSTIVDGVVVEEEAFEVNKNLDEAEPEKDTKIAEENIIHAPRTIRINL